MLHAKIIDLSKEKIQSENAEEFISSSKYGASIIFYGTVREDNENKKVTGITYDSHDELVIKSFKEIYNEIEKKFNVTDKSIFIDSQSLCLNGITKCRFANATYKKETSQVIGCLSKSSQTGITIEGSLPQ